MKKILCFIILAIAANVMYAQDYSAIITMKLSSVNGAQDKIDFYESSEFTTDYDNGSDGKKTVMNTEMMGAFDNAVDFYGVCSWGKATAVATPDLEGTKLAFVSDKIADDVYTITFSKASGTPYYLKDLMTGTLTEIVASGSYTFTQAVSTTEERFEIVAAPLAPLTFINNVLVINEATAGAEVSVTPFSYVNGERVMAAGLPALTAPVNEAFPADLYDYLLVEYTNAEGVARKFIINAKPDVLPAND